MQGSEPRRSDSKTRLLGGILFYFLALGLLSCYHEAQKVYIFFPRVLLNSLEEVGKLGSWLDLATASRPDLSQWHIHAWQNLFVNAHEDDGNSGISTVALSNAAELQ